MRWDRAVLPWLMLKLESYSSIAMTSEVWRCVQGFFYGVFKDVSREIAWNSLAKHEPSTYNHLLCIFIASQAIACVTTISNPSYWPLESTFLDDLKSFSGSNLENVRRHRYGRRFGLGPMIGGNSNRYNIPKPPSPYVRLEFYAQLIRRHP